MATAAAFDSVWNRQIGDLDTAGLIERFQTLERERRYIEADLAELLGEVDRREVFRDDQHSSVKGWARALGKWSDGEARSRARLARLSQALPVVAQAVSNGVLGVAQSHELGRVHSNPRVRDQLLDVIDIFLQHSQNMSFETFQQMVRQWESIADADGSHREHRSSHLQRRASMYLDETTMLLRASGGAVDGARMQEIFERYQSAEYLADWQVARDQYGDDATAAQLPRDAGQRAWDALHRIFQDAASTPADAQAPEPVLNIVADQQTFNEALQEFARLLAAVDGVDGTGNIAQFLRDLPEPVFSAPDDPASDSAVPDAPAPDLLAPDAPAPDSPAPDSPAPDSSHLDAAVDGAPARGAGRGSRSPDPRWWRCATVGGVPLPRSIIIEALLLGQVRRVVIDGAGVAVDVGRKRRFFTGPMRDALMMLTQFCIWPGCSRPSRQSVADHTTDFQHGGATSTSNGGPMCNAHNLRKNRGFSVWRDTTGYWHTYRPDGTEIC